jgi:hypothetical protein
LIIIHPMNRKFLALIAALVCFPVAHSHAQAPAPPAAGLQVRAVLHDPLQPLTDLYVTGQGGTLAKVNLVVEGIGEPQAVTPVNGSLVFYTSDQVNTANPKEHLAATAVIPAGARRLIALVVAVPGATPPYRMMLIEDSARAFPLGEARVVNLTPVDFAMEVGEHKIGLASGKVTRVPPVLKVNEFNQAQTNFFYRKGETWEAFTERQMQYLDSIRRVFLIYSSPGAVQPEVRTISDYDTPAAGQ